MSQPPGPHLADRNLLFGILALQMNFVGRDALVAGMHAWVLHKDRPLGEILLEQGRLTPAQFQALEVLLVQHIEAHGDPQRSLQALPAAASVRPLLTPINDADVQNTLAHVCPLTASGETDAGPGAPSFGGRYRILRPHAGGGLGQVFVAEDAELHREVALKEIRPQFADDPGCRRRFVLEAEVTGGLEHPGVVPVYGLGVYPDGRPFYAMRFIRGESLQKAIDQFHTAGKPDRGERRLAFRHLLRRFTDVCNALAYAHSRGVLHRDLKPANVMLGSFGETLVVDWGLAKPGVEAHGNPDPAQEATIDPVLRPSSGSEPAGTQAGARLGTPVFMSPEMAAGRLHEVGPASDIYGLGAILYVLLTGQKPFTGGSAADVQAKVERGDFAAPRQAKPDTPAALDAVCRKAMALAPADRYRTARDLAADVEHWLADEPVAAYPEPWPLRLARWGRRHRTAVVAAAVFLVSAVVALSVGAALLWREQQETAAQKRRAQENYELARDMGFKGIKLIESAEPAIAAVPALLPARKDLLDTSARAFRHYLEQQPDDPELRRRTAQIYRYAANVHRLAREVDAAEPLYADALRILEGLVKEFPNEAADRQKLAETLRDRASAQAQVGRLRAATDTLLRAVAVSEGEPPSLNLATARLDLSGVEYERGLVAESGKTAARAAELFRARLKLPAGKGHPYDPLLLAAALNQVAVAERDQGRTKPARAAHANAVKLLGEMMSKARTGVNSDDVQHVRAQCIVEQARTLAKSPATRAIAEKNLSHAIQQWQELVQRHPQIARYQAWQAVAYQVRGEVRAAQDRPAEAQKDFDASRKILEGLVKESPDQFSYRSDLGRTYAGLGRLARQAGDREGAAAWFGKAADALRRAVEQAPEVARDQRSLKEVQAELTAK
jgi:serine/threonine-protein kinase